MAKLTSPQSPRVLTYRATAWALTRYVRSLSRVLADGSAPYVESWTMALIAAVAYGPAVDLAPLFDDDEQIGYQVRRQVQCWIDEGKPFRQLAEQAKARLGAAQIVAGTASRALSKEFAECVKRWAADLPGYPDPHAEEPLLSIAAFIAKARETEIHAYFDDPPLLLKLKEHLAAWCPTGEFDQPNSIEALRRLQHRPHAEQAGPAAG